MTSSHSEGREVLRTFVSNVGVDGAPAMAPQQLMEWVASVVVRCLPVVPFVLKFVFGVGGPPPPTLSSPIFLASAALGVASVSACFAYAALVSASASAYFASAALVSASGSAFLTSAALASDGPSSTPPTSPRTSDKGMQSATFPSASALSPSTAAPSPAVTTPQSPAFVGGGAETEALDSNQVVIVGGGIGGVVLALTLQKFRIPFRIVERYPEDGADGGADLALWPSAAAVLQDLGLADKEWWDADTYRVRHSYIATHDGGSATVTKGAVVPDPSTDLTRLSMDRVVGEDSVGFRLVERRKLLERLRALLPVGQASYNCTVEKITSSRDGVKVIGSVQDDNEISCMQTFNGRIAVGADGIKSCCRRYVVAGNDTPIRFGGEVCYRGIVQLDGDNGGEGGASGTSDGTGLRRRRVSDDGHEASPGLAELFAENESMKPESFTIHYGEKTRSAWGYIDGKKTTGFWFVKQLGEPDADRATVAEAWPEPLRTLAAASNPEDVSSYCHAITDRAPLSKWSRENVTLIGDACHSTTPNMGQGACMAIEDAYILGVLLKTYWGQPDGHTEAFYQYERARKAHTAGVQAGSYKKMKLGQLTNPVIVFLRNFALSKVVSTTSLEAGLKAENCFDIAPWLNRAKAFYAAEAAL